MGIAQQLLSAVFRNSRASSLKLLGCRMLACLPKISACADLNSTDHDCLVLVSPDLKDVGHEGVYKALDSVAEIDKKALTSVTLVPVGLPCKRLVYSPTGPLDKDYDDVRREDWDFIKDKSGEFVSVLQCNNAASSRTPRGHQFPATFMMQVAGLDKHMVSSKQPLKYSHLDIAGSSGNLPDPTTGASVAAIVKFFLG